MNTSSLVLFIVGNSRSGTTMLGRVFGNHSQVYTFGELHFFEQQLSARTLKEYSSWPHKRLVALLERLLTSSREGYFQKVTSGLYGVDIELILATAGRSDPISVYMAFLAYETKRQSKVIPCEQTPRYLFFAREILEVLPNARMINMVRDPRSVLLSQKNKWRRRFLGARNIPLREALRSWANYHPYTTTRLWISAVRAAQSMDAHPRFMTIRFEDLMTYPEKTVKTLCSFVGINYEQGMLDVAQVGSSTVFDKPERIGIDAGRSDSWRKGGLSETELAICQNVAKEEMSVFGYCIEPVAITTWRMWGSMTVFAFKALLALLFNLRRTKNLRETLHRRLICKDAEA